MINNGTHSERRISPCPDRIAFIGGGRWARVLTGVVCDLVPPTVRISVHSLHNTEAMFAWAATRGLKRRIQISSSWPQFQSAKSNAVIVANAARDHEKAVEAALVAGASVLVEKPMTLTAEASRRLATLARSQSGRLAAAHVLLFARYLEKFSRLVAAAGQIRSLRVSWMDPRLECRYGEQKRYDPGLPVYADCLPHVLSLAGALTPGLPQRCERLEVLRGGAHVELELTLGDIPCSVQLVRNGDRRQRVVEAATQDRMLQLDFSQEPGIILDGSAKEDGDPDWEVKNRPVARMLTAFLQWAAGGEFDARLNVEIGMQASQVIDQASTLYRAALTPWLIKELAAPGPVADDVRYALSEILQSEGWFPETEIERQIERVRRQFSGASGSRWARKLTETQDPSMILKAVAT